MSIETKEITLQVDAFIYKLKRRHISGSYDVALETSHFLMRVISAARWTHPDQLIELMRHVGARVIRAQPREFSSGNVIRRVLAIIRDEIEAHEKENNINESMFSLLTTNDVAKSTKSKLKTSDLRSSTIQGIRDLVDEISNINESIEAMTVDLIHDGEVLLTPTISRTVLEFLIKARLKRKFTVLVTECFPNDTLNAHAFAKTLSDNKIETVIIPDSLVFAVMSRVGKVIVGAKVVFANGGCVSSAGVAAVCESAKEHRTPVFTVAGSFKLSPNYPFDRDSLIEVGNSGKVLEYDDSDLVSECQVSNPLFDYVPPEHIDLCITNVGGFSPSFIYRIVLDNYKPEDTNL
ncbi:hypothetical protein BABINDRAFT_159552 [Babjeviella inositovora NRRL Y-12698]|uniref:Translation initiation factor eIF2B subunit beta n=1 Tax=Babjeviella inositovora NRRL Y-12698 TaxID=984486 RepID=A0A1E3QZM0_9ASCO|nr:uncharacterized protein BABINDRAFT_159552 [Babjeviella inositovora NRRL Y-12698]ODQ83096.1 hypothetical protein BABINDRAFT_159552 [Babjeviella inositovora NRRL Y-12698]